MKINYDEIITRANQRKNTLQTIAQQLESLQVQVDQLQLSYNYFYNLRQLCLSLDAEGRALLGPVYDVLYDVSRLMVEGLETKLSGTYNGYKVVASFPELTQALAAKGD